MLMLGSDEVFNKIGHFDHLCRPFWFIVVSAMWKSKEIGSVWSRVEEAVERVVSYRRGGGGDGVIALW